LQLLGPAAGVGLALTLLVENLLMIPLSLSLAESGRAEHTRWQRRVLDIFQRLARSPLMGAIVLGFVFSMLGWQMPEPLGKTINLFASACAGIALFVNGGALVGLRVAGLVRQVNGIALAKLILHPLGVAFFLWCFGPVETSLWISGVLLAAMPMMGIYPLFAQRFELEGFCAAALLVTTLVSFFSISLILWGMSQMPGWASITAH
jgi:malonate transporter